MDDLTGALGKSLTSDQFKGLGSKYFGNADMSAGSYDYGGNTYNVADNGNGTRTISNGGAKLPTLNDIGGSATDFGKTLNANENAAFGDYLKAAQSQKSPLDIYNQLETQNNLPQMRQTAASLREAVGTLEDSIRKVEPTVNATTTNSLVTEGQRQKMITDQQYPLTKNLEPISTALGRVTEGIGAAESNVGTVTGLALQGNQLALDPYKQHIQLVADQSARAMTGFTSDRQSQLTLLMQKLQRDQQLSDREWQQAADLKKMQQEYQNNLDLQLKKVQNPSPNYQYVPPSMYGSGGTFNANTGAFNGNGGAAFNGFGLGFDSGGSSSPTYNSDPQLKSVFGY